MLQVDMNLANLKKLPALPGVYLFYKTPDCLPLYIGKSINIRNRVKAHFSQAKHHRKEQRIINNTGFIDWQTTTGEISAFLLEAKLIKQLLPIYNLRLRRHKKIYTLILNMRNNFLVPEIMSHATDTLKLQADYYGLFRSKRQLLQLLESLIQQENLCKKVLQLEKTNRGCFAYQLQQCMGACQNQELAEQHNERLLSALSNYRLRVWPYAGMIGINEVDARQKKRSIHFIKNWHYYGSHTQDLTEPVVDAPQVNQPEFDLDIYKIICKALHTVSTEQLIHY